MDAGQAMLYSAGGLFHGFGTTFSTPHGQTVTRQQAAYLPVAAVQKTTDNYLEPIRITSERGFPDSPRVADTGDLGGSFRLAKAQRLRLGTAAPRLFG